MPVQGLQTIQPHIRDAVPQQFTKPASRTSNVAKANPFGADNSVSQKKSQPPLREFFRNFMDAISKFFGSLNCFGSRQDDHDHASDTDSLSENNDSFSSDEDGAEGCSNGENVNTHGGFFGEVFTNGRERKQKLHIEIGYKLVQAESLFCGIEEQILNSALNLQSMEMDCTKLQSLLDTPMPPEAKDEVTSMLEVIESGVRVLETKSNELRTMFGDIKHSTAALKKMLDADKVMQVKSIEELNLLNIQTGNLVVESSNLVEKVRDNDERLVKFKNEKFTPEFAEKGNIRYRELINGLTREFNIAPPELRVPPVDRLVQTFKSIEDKVWRLADGLNKNDSAGVQIIPGDIMKLPEISGAKRRIIDSFDGLNQQLLAESGGGDDDELFRAAVELKNCIKKYAQNAGIQLSNMELQDPSSVTQSVRSKILGNDGKYQVKRAIILWNELVKESSHTIA